MDTSPEDRPDEALRKLGDEIRIWREEALRQPGGLDDTTLAAYVSGELDDDARGEVERQLASSPELGEMVGAVRETLARGDWQREADELDLDLRPPVLLGTAAPKGAPKAVPKGARILRVLTPIAAAAGVLLVAAIWMASRPLGSGDGPAGPPPADLAMRVYTCSVDAEGRVVARRPLAPAKALPTETHFQVEVTAADASRFCLLHVDPGGKVESLHDGARRGARAGRAGQKLILPSPDRTFRTGRSSGLESLVLARTDAPAELVAGARGIVAEIASPRTLGRERSPHLLAKGSALAASVSESQLHSRPTTRRAERARADPNEPSRRVEAPLSPTTRFSYGLGADQVQELLRRLRKDYDVKGAVVLENRRE